MIKIIFPIKPHPKGRPRFTRRGHVYTDIKTLRFENEICSIAKANYREKPLEGPLSLKIRFCLIPPKKPKSSWPMVRPDLDNYIKSMKDALNEVLWKDDSQVCRLIANKYYDFSPSAKARIELTVFKI